MSTHATKVLFLSCYETTVFLPEPSIMPKIFNSGVSERCLEGVWVTLGTVWKVLMPNQLIKVQRALYQSAGSFSPGGLR